MGNNEAYSTFQHTVITLYNHKALTIEILDELAQEWAGTDIDSGGDTGLLTHDGKNLETVCIGLIDPQYDLTQREGEDKNAYWDRCSEKWYEICGRWGW